MVRVRVWHVFGAAATALPAASVYTLYKYRPRGSYDLAYHEKWGGADPAPSNVVERTLYDVGGAAMVTLIGFLSRTVMNYIHQIDIIDDYKLHALIRSDRDGRPLVTYMNHCSMLDEPLVMACLVPYDIMRDRKRLRWGICTEDVCFSRPHHEALFGSIKAIPVQRGGSLHQKGIAALQRKVNSGDWVHIFAEGRIWQEDGDPQRDAEGRWCSASGRCGPPWQKVGPFKWGIGKVIANAERIPVVLPMFAWGNNAVLPQGRDNNLLPEGPVFNASKLATAMVGDPVDVADLIRSYHAAALERALQRNCAREARLAAALAAEAASASASRTLDVATSVVDYIWSLLGFRSPAASASAAEVGATSSPYHGSDASARIAGLAREAGPEVVAAAAEAHASDARRGVPATAGRAASELARDVSAAAARAMDGVSEAGGSVARDIARAAAGLEEGLAEMARDAEAHARELFGRLAEVERRLRAKMSGAASAGPASGAAGARPGAADATDAAAPSPAPASPPSAFEGSISVPQPRPRLLPAALVPAVASPAPDQGPRRRAPAANDSDLGGAVELSELPALEVVPTRTLANGVVVPTYVEAPLRIKPPDHAFLSLEEARAEEDIRLRLYSDIAARLQDALQPLEARVMARRRTQGWVEDRPMK